MFSFAGDSQCIAAALFFFVGGVFQLIYDQALLDFINEDNDDVFGTILLEELDPDMIETESVAMWYYGKYECIAGISNCIAWVLLATIMIRLAWKFSQGGKRLVGISIGLAMVACVGAFTETIATLMYLGMTRAVNMASVSYDLSGWLTYHASARFEDEDDEMMDDFNWNSTTAEDGDRFLEEEYPEGDDEYRLADIGSEYYDEDVNDGLGWKTLELIRFTMKGMMFWMTSLEFVLLATLFVITFLAVIRSNMLSKGLAYYGLILAAISISELIADSNASHNSLTVFSIFLGSTHRVILLPVWLVWAGRLMRKEELSGIDTDVEIDGSNKQMKEIEINGSSDYGTQFS